MKREIERRFLIDSTKLPKLSHGKLLTQGYLSKLQNPEDPLVRVRLEGKKSYITIKLFQTDLTKQEFEYEIPLKDGEKLLGACLATVQKIRYSLTIASHLWTIDVYEAENFPLVIAEIELKNEEEKFEQPLWITKEVSSDPRFHAYSLAFKPFSTWKRQLTK